MVKILGIFHKCLFAKKRAPRQIMNTTGALLSLTVSKIKAKPQIVFIFCLTRMVSQSPSEKINLGIIGYETLAVTQAIACAQVYRRGRLSLMYSQCKT